jgi:hypothetical protein
MPPVGFEPTISAVERPKTYALDRAATGTGSMIRTNIKLSPRVFWVQWSDGDTKTGWKFSVIITILNTHVVTEMLNDILPFDTLVTTYCNHCHGRKEVARLKHVVFSLYIIHIRRNAMTDPQNSAIFRVNLQINSHDLQGLASTDKRHAF